MKVAVVGAGWAGLAAAVRAADQGHQVTVFEASHTLGGRARRVRSRKLDVDIDNGQHLLLGAYSDTLALMHRLGVDARSALKREPLAIESADGTFSLRLAGARSPWHLVVGLMRARGLTMAQKWQMTRAIRYLQTRQWALDDGTTVSQWLDACGQSAHVRRLFWHPLCVAALNTPPQEACGQLFANVLRDSLGNSASACDTLLPTLDLSALWPDRVEHLALQASAGSLSIQRGAAVSELGVNVPGLKHESTGQDKGAAVVNGRPFDAVILACNIPSVLRLLRPLAAACDPRDDTRNLVRALERFRYIPIATLTLELEREWALPRDMLLLKEDRSKNHFGQWLFNCSGYLQPPSQTSSPGAAPRWLVHVVISDAASAAALPSATLLTAISEQLADETRHLGPMPTVINHDLIIEKRATFAATPGLARPQARTPWPQIWLAGDWTDTGYPAVLEGAVRSGQDAVEALHRAGT